MDAVAVYMWMANPSLRAALQIRGGWGLGQQAVAVHTWMVGTSLRGTLRSSAGLATKATAWSGKRSGHCSSHRSLSPAIRAPLASRQAQSNHHKEPHLPEPHTVNRPRTQSTCEAFRVLF